MIFLKVFTRITVLGLLALAVFPIFSRTFYYADLIAQFYLQYSILAFVFSIPFFAVKGGVKWGVIGLIAAGIHVFPMWELYTGTQQNTPATYSGTPVSLLSFNLLLDNQNHQDVIQYLRQEDPDILVLMEYTPTWHDELVELKASYPYRMAIPLEGYFGIAVYSKIQGDFTDKRYVFDEIPSILASLGTDSLGYVDLLATHPPPPSTKANWEARNEQFHEIALDRRGFRKETLLVGDLNTTSASRHFTDLLANTYLNDSRIGKGIQLSWPTDLPIAYICLDHVLASKAILVHNRAIGPANLGSDHRPVLMQFELPK